MSVRKKIALLITAAGFTSSLIFSIFILSELIEEPYRIIDSELKSTGHQTLQLFLRTRLHQTKLKINDDNDVPAKSYWIKIYKTASHRLLYQSFLAKQIAIPQSKSGKGHNISTHIPKKKMNLQQDWDNEVTFRVKQFIFIINNQSYEVIVGKPVEFLDESIWGTYISVGGGLIISILFLLVVSYLVAGSILKPVRVINNQIRLITEEHLDYRIPVTTDKDEFNDLAKTLNIVFDRLENAFLRQKKLLADTSHELKTPLTIIRLTLDELVESTSTSTSNFTKNHNEDKTSRMTEQVLRMEQLVKNILDISALEAEPHIQKAPIDLTCLFEELLEDYRFIASTKEIKIEEQLLSDLACSGNREKLFRAFSNLLDNAIKYNFDGGKIKIAMLHSIGQLKITISNTGPGVSEDEAIRVFDYFYRAETSRSLLYGGSGLGLAMVKKIVDIHGGTISFESTLNQWTHVTIRLPCITKTHETIL